MCGINITDISGTAQSSTPAHEAALSTMPGTKEKMTEPQVMLFYSRLQAAAAMKGQHHEH